MLYKEIILFTHLFAYLLSWEANRFSANQEIPYISWKPKVYFLVYKCPPPVPILSQIDPVHAPTPHFLKFHFNIISPSTPGSSKWSLPLVFPPKPCIYFSSSHTCYMPRHLILLAFITQTILGEGYRSLSSSLCSFLHSPVTSSLLGSNILLSTIFSKPSAYVPPSMWSTKFHTHTEQKTLMFLG